MGKYPPCILTKHMVCYMSICSRWEFGTNVKLTVGEVFVKRALIDLTSCDVCVELQQ